MREKLVYAIIEYAGDELDHPDIGRWARDVISVSKTKPKEKDLVELVPNFLMD